MHRKEGQVAAVKLESPLSVPFSRWQADLWSLLAHIQDHSSPPYTGRITYIHHNYSLDAPHYASGKNKLGKLSNKMNLKYFLCICAKGQCANAYIETEKGLQMEETGQELNKIIP